MQHPSKPLAKTRQGTLSGSAEQGIHIWRGIPYAAPPVGPLRWRAPQPPPAGRASPGRRLFRRQLAGH
jgi:para-nitrobenzyl esterase